MHAVDPRLIERLRDRALRRTREKLCLREGARRASLLDVAAPTARCASTTSAWRPAGAGRDRKALVQRLGRGGATESASAATTSATTTACFTCRGVFDGICFA